MNDYNLKAIFTILIIVSIAISSCKKKEEEETQEPTVYGTIDIGMSDARAPHSNKDPKSGIVNSTDLTKCEITISSIQLKNNEGSYVDILTSVANVDLRQFQGTVKDLITTNIPAGSYTSIRVNVSGVSTTYEGNNYTASSSSSASVTLANPSMTLNESSGVPNVFSSGNIIIEMPLSFSISNSGDIESVRLFFDAEASTYIESFTYQTYTWNFAGIRAIPFVSVILEENIQQIRHSPPYGITITSSTDVNYYGIHTFVDFNAKGGTINSHTSQHVFRGNDGSLLVNAEDMITNANPLSPNTVASSGESDIRADETFKYAQISSYLSAQGYTLQPGETYYFSLRKTWNITSDGNTYDLTRICEPLPITIP